METNDGAQLDAYHKHCAGDEQEENGSDENKLYLYTAQKMSFCR